MLKEMKNPLHQLIVKLNDSILDDHQNFIFNTTGSLFLNNLRKGHLENIIGPNGSPLTGHNCMKLTLTTGSLSLTYNVSQII